LIVQINTVASITYLGNKGVFREVDRTAASGLAHVKLESRIASELRITIIFYA